MKGWLNRLMGRSVTDLAKEVDDAKALLDAAEGRLAYQQGLVAAEEDNVLLARRDYDAAVQALIDEHPHLVGVDRKKEHRMHEPMTHDEALANPSAWDPEVVEVDDENDPRYTGGAPAISPKDTEPIGTIDFDLREEEV